MELIDKIKIDMARKGNTPVVYAMQGDYNSRLISATLFNNGFPIDVNGNAVSVAYKKPDGTSGWYDTLPDGNSAICIEASEVLAKIAPEMLTVPGMVYAAIRIESESGESRATTFPFVVNVSEDPGYNSAKSENYYNVQNWDDVNSKFAEIEELLKTVGNGIDDTVISKESTWSSKNIVDKLCPSFTESGGVVTCEPVEGYPLEVVSHINKAVSGVTLQHCLTLDPNIYEFFNAYIDVSRQMWLANADSRSIRMPCKPNTTYVISHNNSMETIFRVACIETDAVPSVATVPTAVIVQGQTDALTVTTTEQTKYLVVQASKAQWDNTITSLIVCEARTVNHVDFGKTVNGGTYNWTLGILTDEKGNTTTLTPNTVTAFDGINVFVSDCGNTTVSGKSDPVAIIEKQETIIAEQEAELAKLNKQYELIEEVTLEEDVESFTRTADTNGNPYNFSAMRIYVDATAAEGANNNSQMIFSLGTKSNNFAIYLQATGGITNTARNTLLNAQNENGFRSVWFATATSGGTSTNIQTRSAHYTYIWENVTRLALSTHPSTLKIPAGTCIRIYGIRG